MARDYAARNRKPAARPAGLPGWVWLVAGLSMGLVVAVIVYIGRPAQPMPMAPAAGAAALASAKPKTKVEIPPKEEPRFDFYTLLEDEQVVVSPNGKQPKLGALPPDAAALPPAPKPVAVTPPSTPATPSTPVTTAAASRGGEKFLVLAGSFRDLTNAEQHRARLAMAGIESRIEPVTGKDGGTWHRVRIGPQANQERAEATLAQLRASGFEGKVLRQP